MDIVKFNQSKKIKISTNIGIVLISIFIIASFAQYYSMKLNLDNPLIHKDMVEMFAKPYLRKGIILLIGLITACILKYLKQNFFALSITILLVTYYIFSNHHIGGWNTQIN